MQAKPTRPCSSREHLESIDEPGHCVWCDAVMQCRFCSGIGEHSRTCRAVAALLDTPQPTSLTEIINLYETGKLPVYRAIAMAYDLGSQAVLQLQQGAQR